MKKLSVNAFKKKNNVPQGRQLTIKDKLSLLNGNKPQAQTTRPSADAAAEPKIQECSQEEKSK